MEALYSDEIKDSPVQPNYDEMIKTLAGKNLRECQNNIPVDNTKLLEAHSSESTEKPRIEQEILMDKHETLKPTEVDKSYDFYINESELETKEDKLTGTIKVKTEERKAPLLMNQNVETKLEGIPDNFISHYIRSDPEKVIETEIKISFHEDRGCLTQRVSDKDLEHIDQVDSGTQLNINPSRTIETQNEQISRDDIQPKCLNQDPETQVYQILNQDPEAQNEQIPNSEPELIFGEDTNTQLGNIPGKEPQSKGTAREDLKKLLKITTQATNTETPEQDPVKSESLGLRTQQILDINTMENLSILKNTDKYVREENTQAQEDKPSRTASERGTQVTDTVLKTASEMSTKGPQDSISLPGEREAKTSVDKIKSMKTTPSKSSHKSLSKVSWQVPDEEVHYPKVSSKCDFFTKSPREWKWSEVSHMTKYIDHDVPGEQTMLVQSSCQMFQTAKSSHYVSPEMLKFKEVFSDVKLNSDLVQGFQDAFEFFRKDKTKQVDMNDLQYSLSTMGIHLTHQDTFEALKSADIDGDGKVNFCDFLVVLTDNRRFLITIDRKRQVPVSEQEYLDTVLFDAISRLLQKCSLPRKSAAEIAKYYQEKFEAIPQLPKLEGSKSQVMVDFARGTRIMGMTDRQLIHYLEEIKAIKGSCVGSPYDVIPCVPLCTNMDKKLSGRPYIPRLVQKSICNGDKETSDLDRQMDVRGMRHHGIQVDIYIPGCRQRLNPIPIDLRLSTKKLQKLNMNDHGLVRHKVDLGKKRFLERVTRRKKSSMLHFWDKIQGDQIEQETKNPILCKMFYTYSCSWDPHRELLAKGKHCHLQTASSPLGTGIQWSYINRYCSFNAEQGAEYQGKLEKSDKECTEVLNDSSWDLHKTPNVALKAEEEDIIQE